MRISDWSSDVCSSDLSVRGLSWIERSGSNIVAIWPMETAQTTLEQRGGQRWYRYADESGGKLYPAADVIDVPFALKPVRLAVYRSEKRRVGKERVSKCRSRWSPCH